MTLTTILVIALVILFVLWLLCIIFGKAKADLSDFLDSN